MKDSRESKSLIDCCLISIRLYHFLFSILRTYAVNPVLAIIFDRLRLLHYVGCTLPNFLEVEENDRYDRTYIPSISLSAQEKEYSNRSMHIIIIL
jgi:hypothetical protein